MSQYPGLRGKRILITGATSGLGFAMARALVQEGATVLISGRPQVKIDAGIFREEGMLQKGCLNGSH